MYDTRKKRKSQERKGVIKGYEQEEGNNDERKRIDNEGKGEITKREVQRERK